MRTRDSIKEKVEKLDPYDLRIVELLIDSLTDKRKVLKKKSKNTHPPYLDVIKILGKQSLTSEDINTGRQERI